MPSRTKSRWSPWNFARIGSRSRRRDPAMSTPKLPLPAYSFIVSVQGENIRFSDVSGLEVSRDAVAYRHGLSFGGEMLITAPSRNHISLTLKRGVTQGDGFFFQWLISDKAEARPMDVSLVDSSGQPAVTWHV